MTIDLQAIKERVVKATIGPWKVFKSQEGTQIGTAYDHPQIKGPVQIVSGAIKINGHEAIHQVYISDDNADFIAHSREDISKLVAEVEQLQKELEKVRNSKHWYRAFHQIDEENARLREALEKILDEEETNLEGYKTTVYEIAEKALGVSE